MKTNYDIILGGLISLISTIVGFLLQYFLSRNKIRYESKLAVAKILFNKQLEFLELYTDISEKLNNYVTNIYIWLLEKNEEAKLKAFNASSNNGCIEELDKVLEKYHMYLPSNLLKMFYEIRNQFTYLSQSPNLNKAEICIEILFNTKNELRKLLGIDTLSKELIGSMKSKYLKKI